MSGQGARAVRWPDLVWPLLLFGGALGYLLSLPPNLGAADESVYLYQARRVLEGAVPYRDVFDLTTPGWLYVMAALFGVFGVSIETARAAAAVLHGGTMVMLYATCRALGVRPGLAWPAGFAYLLVCQPAWPIASQHWLATALGVLLLLLCARLPAAPAARAAFWPGVVAGALVAVHQQRGLAIGAGLVVWLILDHLLCRRDAGAARAPLWRTLVWCAAGSAAVLAPLFVYLIAAAGFAPVWEALVLHPLFSYRPAMRATWGQRGGILAESGTYTFPDLLTWLPLVLVPAAVRTGVLLARGGPLAELRRLVLLLVFAVFAIASIAYYPDYIHIAFIAPLFFVAAAELAERAAAALPARVPLPRAAGVVAGAALLVAGGLRLADVRARLWQAFPISRDTAFGRVAFARPLEAALYDTLRPLLDQTPSRALFCYPVISHLYLMLDADNPTRFQFLLRGYTTPEQMDEVLAVLERRRPPYIVALTGFLAPDDPILAFLRRAYAPLDDAGPAGQAIFRRLAPDGADVTAPAAAGGA